MAVKNSQFGSKPTSIPDILVVGQTPPPVHGQSVMTQLFLDARHSHIRITFVRMAFSHTIGEVGKVRWQKVAEMVSLLVRVFRVQMKTRAEILHYLPASPNLVRLFSALPGGCFPR